MKTKIVAAASFAAAIVAVASADAGINQDQIPYQPGNPLTNGCPSGSEALSVADLTALGYQVGNRIDSPSAGGNGDGIVCGMPWTTQEQDARLPNAPVPIIFNFRDNTLRS